MHNLGGPHQFRVICCLLQQGGWGHEDLWLHTEVSNGVAQQLYSSLGYREVKRDPRFFGPFRRILLRKTLPSRRSGGSQGAQPADLQAGGRTRNGVYVWDVAQE